MAGGIVLISKFPKNDPMMHHVHLSCFTFPQKTAVSQVITCPLATHLVQRGGRDNLNSCDLTWAIPTGDHWQQVLLTEEKEKWQSSQGIKMHHGCWVSIILDLVYQKRSLFKLLADRGWTNETYAFLAQSTRNRYVICRENWPLGLCGAASRAVGWMVEEKETIWDEIVLQFTAVALCVRKYCRITVLNKLLRLLCKVMPAQGKQALFVTFHLVSPSPLYHNVPNYICRNSGIPNLFASHWNS